MYKLIGRKKDMSQIFGEDWKASPVTLVDVSGNVVAKLDKKHAFVGFGRKKHPSKAALGTFKKLGYVPQNVVLADAADYDGKKVRDSLIKKELLGAKVKVSGKSKGKGFAGGHKRFDIKGGPQTRGQSTTARKIGSIGSQTIGRVFKGVKMPGHMGHGRVSIKNAKVVYLDEENGVIGIKGHLPGGRNTILTITVTEWGKPEAPKTETEPKTEEKAAEKESKVEEKPKAEAKSEPKAKVEEKEKEEVKKPEEKK